MQIISNLETSKLRKRNVSCATLDDNAKKAGDEIESQNDLNLNESEINEDEEKTGWWS